MYFVQRICAIYLEEEKVLILTYTHIMDGCTRWKLIHYVSLNLRKVRYMQKGCHFIVFFYIIVCLLSLFQHDIVTFNKLLTNIFVINKSIRIVKISFGRTLPVHLMFCYHFISTSLTACINQYWYIFDKKTYAGNWKVLNANYIIQI